MYATMKSLQPRFTLAPFHTSFKQKTDIPDKTPSPYHPTSPSNRLSFSEDDLVDFDPAEYDAQQIFPHNKSGRRDATVAPREAILSLKDFVIAHTHVGRRISSLRKSLVPERPLRRLTLRLPKALQPTKSTLAPSPEGDLTPRSPIQVPLSPVRTSPIGPSLEEGDYQPFASLAEQITTIFADNLSRPPAHYDNDPFGAESSNSPTSPTFPPSPSRQRTASIEDPNTIAPSPPISRVPTPASITPSNAVSSIERPLLQRLKTVTRNSIFFASRPKSDFEKALATVPVSSEPVIQVAPSSASSVPLDPPSLPELAFDTTPLVALLSREYAPDPAAIVRERQDSHLLPVQAAPEPRAASLHEPHPIPAVPHINWERVDPKDLTPSPFSAVSAEFLPDEPPSTVPSPSWLSRNVRDLERQLRGYPPVALDPPAATDSPAPLPILPRSLLPVVSRSPSVANSPLLVVSELHPFGSHQSLI